MSDWTFKEVASHAEQSFHYYEEKEAGSGVREAMASILSDLGKFEEGRVVLHGMNGREVARIMEESDDTAMWSLIEAIKHTKVNLRRR